jgi:hypothetical protein
MADEVRYEAKMYEEIRSSTDEFAKTTSVLSRLDT